MTITSTMLPHLKRITSIYESIQYYMVLYKPQSIQWRYLETHQLSLISLLPLLIGW